MADAITDILLDMAPHTLIAQPGTEGAEGDFTPSGSPLSLACRISVKNRLIRTESGEQVVSSAMATVMSTPGLSTRGFRYDLPSEFSPRLELEAMAIKKVSDENGPHHEVVFFR